MVAVGDDGRQLAGVDCKSLLCRFGPNAALSVHCLFGRTE